MKPVFILSALALASCVSVEPYKTPDGRTAYLIECNGAIQSIAACMNRAAELCGGPYDLLNRQEGGTLYGSVDDGDGVIGTTKDRTIEVACKS